ncbi:hypothetical protein C8R44DRAFT_744680 [Mycena epipterygia]|nr:hypothetical protein C8R44DRAFT_744680 [Mycena epipterygia]
MLKLAFLPTLLVLFLCSSAVASATAAASTSRNGIAAPEVVPVSAVGNVAAIQGTVLGDTHLFFQNPDNSVEEFAMNSPLTAGAISKAVVFASRQRKARSACPNSSKAGTGVANGVLDLSGDFWRASTRAGGQRALISAGTAHTQTSGAEITWPPASAGSKPAQPRLEPNLKGSQLSTGIEEDTL